MVLKGESMSIKTKTMAAGGDGIGAAAVSSRLIHKNQAERKN